MEILEILQEYFIKPIISPEVQGYNLINTSVFIILLIIACIIIYKTLKNKIEFNQNFFISIIPYIVFGVSLRVLMHRIESGALIIPGIIKTANPFDIGFWFFTPGVWILTFTIVILGLLFSGMLKKINYKRLFLFGTILAAPIFLFNLISFNNWAYFTLTVILIIISTKIITFIVQKYSKYKILNDKTNLFIVYGQAIDGIASVIAITFFNFTEQHIVSNFVINIHPALFVIIKLILAVLICFSLDDYVKENPSKKNLVGFVKIIIAILGFATGLASLIKLGII